MTVDALHLTILDSTLIKVLVLGFLGFSLSMALTPIYTTLAYRRQWWKRQRTESWNGGAATVYNQLHAAVLRPAFRRIVRGHRIRFPQPFRSHRRPRHALLNSILSPLASTAKRRSMLNCVTTAPNRVSILCFSYQASLGSSNFLGCGSFSRKKFFERIQRL